MHAWGYMHGEVARHDELGFEVHTTQLEMGNLFKQWLLQEPDQNHNLAGKMPEMKCIIVTTQQHAPADLR